MNKERIANLLASGLKAVQVATIVGLSPARISQLYQEPDFVALLELKTAEQEEKDQEEIAISAKYNLAEHLLLDQITQLAPVSELRDVVGALRVVAERQDKAKTRNNPVPMGGGVTLNTIVQLSLPQQVFREIHMSSNKEVTGIGENNLAPLSSEGVTSLFTALKNRKEGEDNVQATVPLSTEGSSTEALSLPKDFRFLESI